MININMIHNQKDCIVDSFPVHLESDTTEELATLAQFGLIDGRDLPDDLVESIINSDNN